MSGQKQPEAKDPLIRVVAEQHLRVYLGKDALVRLLREHLSELGFNGEVSVKGLSLVRSAGLQGLVVTMPAPHTSEDTVVLELEVKRDATVSI